MNILVCVKQVPDTTEIKIDPVKNTLIRKGVPSIVNPFDGYALETALRIKDKNSDVKITVLSMGPPQAEAALKECLAVGADQAYLMTDRMFGGSDTLATGYILSEGIKYIEEEKGEKFDLVLAGMQAIDGDTGQVGPGIAENLKLPVITYVFEAEEVSDKVLKVKRENENGYEVYEVHAPALFTVMKTPYDLRFANIMTKMKANKAEIPHITMEELGHIDTTKIGLKGSPTKVKKTFTPDLSKKGVIRKDEDAETAVAKLLEELTSEGLL